MQPLGLGLLSMLKLKTDDGKKEVKLQTIPLICTSFLIHSSLKKRLTYFLQSEKLNLI